MKKIIQRLCGQIRRLLIRNKASICLSAKEIQHNKLFCFPFYPRLFDHACWGYFSSLVFSFNFPFYRSVVKYLKRATWSHKIRKIQLVKNACTLQLEGYAES